MNNPAIRFTRKHNEFELLEDLEIELTNGDIRKIEKGRKFDGKTVPRIGIQVSLLIALIASVVIGKLSFVILFSFLTVLLACIQRFGSDLIASIVHDDLYGNSGEYSRKFCDEQMMFYQLLSGRSVFFVSIVYLSLRLGGWFLFYKNKKQ